MFIPDLYLAANQRIGDSAREIGETFGWNVRLFLSQVISFIIVALLLKQFAYKPILAVLEERRQRIAEGLLNAEKIKQQLAEAEQRYQEILAKGNGEAQKMIDEARASAGDNRRAQTAGSNRRRRTNPGQGAGGAAPSSMSAP